MEGNYDRLAQEKDAKEMLKRIPVVERQKSEKLYKIDRKVNEMLQKGTKYKDIVKEVQKMRKYSY